MTEEIIVYSLLVVLLPIIPSYILYKFIPSKDSGQVDGTYKGLNIKFKGAFAGYFIVALMLSGSIVGLKKTAPKYELWTVEGRLDINAGNKPVNPHLVSFYFAPPHNRVLDNGTFELPDIPLPIDRSETPSLTLSRMVDGNEQRQVISLSEEKKEYESEKKYGVKWEKNKNGKNVITITTPIIFEEEKKIAGEYNPDDAMELSPVEE